MVNKLHQAIILTQNERNADERYDWEDIEGVKYHFPNQYKNHFQSGKKFVYYKGVRRKNKKTGLAEYFGYGTIGEVWRDERIDQTRPKREWSWFCEILDYVPFKTSVIAKKDDGTYFESVKGKNYWRNGVRDLSFESLNDIIKAAGDPELIVDLKPMLVQFPPTDQLNIILADNLLVTQKAQSDKKGSPASGGRRSKISNEVGHVAEKIAEKYLKQLAKENKNITDLVRVSTSGLKPGWDIEYKEDGGLIAVEVKGTTGEKFPSVELTINEWKAAERMGEKYHLCLVTRCRSKNPHLQIIKNLKALYTNGKIGIDPLLVRLTLK